MKNALLLLGLYAALVFSVLGNTPLWLDEVQQVRGTKGHTVFEALHWAQINPGGVPLPYLVQKYFLDLTPYSTYAARVPAAFFSILSGLAFALLCRELGIRKLSLAMALFLLVPIQFRYAVEARGYSQGLLFSILATWLFIRLWDRHEAAWLAAWLAAYGVIVVLGAYSQPLTGLVPIAHLAWALVSRASPRRKATILLTIALALACYLPWLIFQHRAQQQTPDMPVFSFSLQQIYPWGVVHELCGGGYACSLPILILAGFGFTSRNLSHQNKRLLAFVAVIALLGPILADAAIGYFFAARQLLFGVPILLLLASEGALELWRKSRTFPVVALLAVFAGASLVRDYHQATRIKENWERAAEILASFARPGKCLLVTPPEQMSFYAFFRPELRAYQCLPGVAAETVITAVSIYDTPQEVQRAFDSVPQGSTLQETQNPEGIKISVYRRGLGRNGLVQ